MQKLVTCVVFSVWVALTMGDPLGNDTDGYNFCDEAKACHCVLDLDPVTVLCTELKLKLIYEQADFLATIDAMNISANATLDMRFENNQIEVITRFPPLPIVMLSFHHNHISKIDPEAFKELNQLTMLDLSMNRLESEALFEQVFIGPNATGGYFPIPLVHLNLSRNYIHSLDKNAFDHLIYLKTIDLSYNPLKVLSGSTSQALSSLRRLEYLGLGYTGVSEMHEGMLHDLKNLSSLDLIGNEFVKVPRELRFTHSLTVLSLERNKFETLDKESFVGLDTLEDLSLVGNEKLKSVEEGTFGPLKSLYKLDLSNCKRLDNLNDGAFLGLVQKENISNWNLKDIRLNDNGLSQIDEALAPWEYVDYIDISNNPFRCDCNLEWMLTNLMPRINKIKPSLARNVNCAQPKAMRGKSLVKLMDEKDLFAKCRDSKDELFPEEISFIPSGSYRTAGITILVISVLIALAGVSVAVFIVVKRRAIQKALVAHQEIRYERAESDDDGIGGIHTSAGKNRRF